MGEVDALAQQQMASPALIDNSDVNTASTPIRVMVWTGHSGPCHDHFYNGGVLARGLNASKEFVAILESDEDAFLTLDQYDVLLILADTYENPHRGNLTSAQWTSIFSFVENGGGFFALHTASA